MGQCLSATLKILVAVNQANQEQQPQPDAHHGHDSKPQKGAGFSKPTTTTPSTTSASKLSPIYTLLPDGAESATVRNVYDGDTLTLSDDRRVRFLGVDTPELKENQPFSSEARDYTKRLCENKTIYLSSDGEAKDHYGRILAHVYVKNESGGGYVCVNEGIVAAGLASVYSPSQDQKTRNYDKLIQLQAHARDAGLGIHGGSNGGNSDQLVVKTKNGSAYHIRSCENLDPNWYLEEMKISEAQDKGLHACRTCLS